VAVGEGFTVADFIAVVAATRLPLEVAASPAKRIFRRSLAA
jgi:hypothetical protein